VKILIAGDFYVSDKHKGKHLIDTSIKQIFSSVDFRIINQESTITENNPKNKILKTGPHLRSSVETILPYLKQLKVDMVTLANNHILDYGAKGLSDTFKTLLENQISHVGAGNSLHDAKKPKTLEKDGLKLAILNFTENEWSIANEDKPGANPLDIIDNVTQIKAAKAKHDKVICIIHGGHEYNHLPSPRMVKQYRFYVDNGADAIVGHHTHCIGGYEVYNTAPIIYSLGNFLFTIPSKQEEWYSGLLVELNIRKELPIVIELIPIRQEKESFIIKLENNVRSKDILNKVQKYSNIIQNEFELNKYWDSFSQKIGKQYLNYFSPIQLFNNRYLNAGVKKIGIDKWLMSKKQYKLILNILRCEAHKDCAIKSLNTFIKEKRHLPK
jgi:poly-gamma-glutamate capsule biosynthesis protein CapA/YwtB (metallophosphatase superfamily)